MSEDKTFSFLKGILVGAIAGAVTGVLLAPKSGVETREDLKKLAVDFGDKANELYTKASTILKEKLTSLKKAGKQINRESYLELVSQVVDEIKKDGLVTEEVAQKISAQLKTDWALVKEELKK
ncbi:MAG TPA: YtxH domain-containing protein [Candidatus Dojkabacteria bacterium]|jgi:gas vesicle protein|nr:YtxH domain-containing protein [Candidatus Dojkabacteria bacterium]HOT60931.1 YtxH domain-containing protein [Candidatus Dojkabacteria bacterium]HQI92826.1 YtxH domain-containing protein [Candidatus Dojkabacteria bacterium]